MGHIDQLLQFVLHIDKYLFTFVSTYGIWTYVVLFAVIFCETGLVITPFLPGDSLIFAAGSIAANAQHNLSIQLLAVLLIIASVLGNQLNYFIGRFIGPKVFSFQSSWLLNRKYLDEAHQFYAKHGGKTIILARFIPIIRTFAPFVAGVGYMRIRSFCMYNLISAALWIGSLLVAGYYLGSLAFVQDNFSALVYGIILLSVLPPILAMSYRRLFSRE